MTSKKQKTVKQKYIPKFSKQKDIHGNRVKYGELAEKTAEYLSKVQWKPPQTVNTTRSKKVLGNPVNVKTYAFELDEIKYVLKKL